MAKEYRYIGKATPRIDAEEIVTGEAEFIDDLKYSGCFGALGDRLR